MVENPDPVERDADAAAAQAGEIGSAAAGNEDPERRPVEEGGGGESEGFEQAEEALREHAEPSDPAPDPAGEGFDPEIESDRETGAARGQADELRSSERTGEP